MSKRRKIALGIFKTLIVLSIIAALTAMGLFLYAFLQPLPPPSPPIASELFDDENELVGTLGAQKRFEVPLSQVPLDFQRAIVAIEDHRFFQHKGIDFYGIARAVWVNIRTRSRSHGASTITQQLARNAYGLTQQKLFSRKLKEAIIALQLESNYTKEEILEFYLNTIYFGHGTYGLESAARLYFGKSTPELTLSESATLAGLVRGPGYYSPYVSQASATKRRNVVLDRMVENEFITSERATEAKQQDVQVAGFPKQSNIDHFRNAIMEFVSNELFKNDPEINGTELLRTGGLKIYTTMNLQMQEAAERAVEEWDQDESNEGLQIALAAVETDTGQVKALVGSRDLDQSTWARTFAARPAGSAFKPFLYLAALETRAYTAATVLVSEPTEFDIKGQDEVYAPSEYTGSFFGPLTLREALAKSSNVISIKLNQDLAADPYEGPWSQQMIETAHDMGIKSALDPVLSLPLGVSDVTPLEMATSYAPLANGGYRVEPFYIRRIVDKQGQVLLENRTHLTKAVDAQAAYIVTDMLTDVLQPGGTAAHLRWQINRIAAGKTGTSEDSKDGWFVGYTPKISCAVWTGDDQNQKKVRSGGGTAGPVWAYFMREGLQGNPLRDFERPPGIIEVTIDPESGQLVTSECPQEYTELFIDGTQPTKTCELHPEPWFPPDEEDEDEDDGGNWWDWIFGD